MRLGECEHLAQFVERPEAAGKDHQRPGEVGKRELPHEEVVELERQLRRLVAVGYVLVRQGDV
jgi:hypothetical protein